MLRKLVGLGLALWSAAAVANTFETFGFGPRGVAMGGALTADANDYTSVFYNPAMLVLRKDVNFGFTFSWYRAMTEVTPLTQGRTLDCQYCKPPDAVGYTSGLLFPLGGKVKNRVAIGLGVYLPAERLLRLQTADPDRPYWYHYSSNPERIVVHLAAGVRILDELSVGLGIQALADLVGQGARLRVDLFNKEVHYKEIDSHLAARTAPVAGLLFAPTPRLRFGASYRWEMSLFYEVPAAVELEDIGTLSFTVNGLAHFTPHTLNVGGAFDVLQELTLAVDAQWANWSAAPSPYMNVEIDLSGDMLKALGLDEAFDVSSVEPSSRRFSDTVSVRVGGEYRVTERLALRAGGSYRPTAVPLQDAPRTNILDGSALAGSVGVGLSFADPLEIFEHPVSIDAAAQGVLLLPREATKDSTDPVPSYRYEGKIVGVSAAIRYDF